MRRWPLRSQVQFFFSSCIGAFEIFLRVVEARPTPSSQATTAYIDSANKGFNIAISMVVISACVIIAAIATTVTCYFKAKRMHKEFDTPQPDMIKLLNDRKDTMVPSDIREKTQAVLNISPGHHRHKGVERKDEHEDIDKLLGAIRNEEKEKAEIMSGEIEVIHGARDGGKLLIKHKFRLHFLEHATNLHISKMEDYYGNRILLAMAPLKDQFVDQWEAIWRQSVGVIVWVGPLMDKDVQSMDSYIGMTENDVIYIGPFCINTVSAKKRFMGYDRYNLVVRRSRRRGKMKVTLFHAHSWPQGSVSCSLQKDVDLLTDIKNEHVSHIGDGLPTMLFQCKYGTAGSATLLASYIGYQMWARDMQVNVVGILKCVRSRRWMAFEQTGDKDFSFLTQIQVAYAIMYAVAKWHETGQVTQCETLIKNTLEHRPAVSSHKPHNVHLTPKPI